MLGQLQVVTMFSNVRHLSANGDHVELSPRGDMDLIEFLRLFPAVEALRLSGGLAA